MNYRVRVPAHASLKIMFHHFPKLEAFSVHKTTYQKYTTSFRMKTYSDMVTVTQADKIHQNSHLTVLFCCDR